MAGPHTSSRSEAINFACRDRLQGLGCLLRTPTGHCSASSAACEANCSLDPCWRTLKGDRVEVTLFCQNAWLDIALSAHVVNSTESPCWSMLCRILQLTFAPILDH